MKAAAFTARSVPIALALVTIAAYGLLLPLTGFYWDDWAFAWIARFLGPSAFIPAFAGFRPFLGPIFFLTTSLLPTSPVVWQIFALLIHFLAAWAAWFLFSQVWQQRRFLTVAAAFLFLIFPGYSQHWVAFTHINQEWISLIAYMLSFALSIRLFRAQKPAWAIAAALLLQALGLLPTEYFVGLEFLRPLFFWVVASQSTGTRGQRFRSVIRAWWPYLLLWLANAVWLAYYYRSGAYISYDPTAAQNASAPLPFLGVLGDALWKAGLYVWVQVIPLLLASIGSPTSLLAIALMAIALPVLGFYLRCLDLSDLPMDTAAHDPSTDFRIAGWALLIGALGILLGRVPSFAAGLPLTLQSSFDRLTISMMLGASLFVAGLLTILITRLRARTYALALLVALGIGQQFFNANIFRRDWQRQQEIYWQLAWRIPALEPNTAILTQQMPLDYETDLAMTAALNWIYARDVKPPVLPYAMIYTEKRVGGVALPGLEPGLPMRLPLRTIEFNGNTSQAIVIYVPGNGCLRVFDPANDDAATYSRLPESIAAAIPLSDPGRIQVDADPHEPPYPPFGQEPARGWCYYYEKAELARQVANWQGIAALHAEASGHDVSASDPFEWLPFIEAEAMVGNAEWAAATTRESLKVEPRVQRGLCALWRRVRMNGPTASQALSAGLMSEMGCGD